MFNLEGKVILVTGGSRGIGAATVRAVGEAGADVIVHYKSNRDAAERVAAEVGGERCHLIQANFESDEEILELWRKAIAWKGRIDVLVNNAGIMEWAGVEDDFATWSDAFRKTLQVNVNSCAHLCYKAVPHFRERGGGIIITISSQVAHQGARASETMAYATSKAAIRALTQTVARCHSIENILAYAIAPGIVDTDIAADFIKRFGSLDGVLAGLAMHEMVPPEDVAAVVAYLATGKSRHATGTTVDMTGATYIR
ncbi:MAG TPA: SDR family oxidoreductase [Rhodospirillales bacterium]|nr:SDR family oxidoreductase [Rhodospirillales bacterium]